MAFEMKEPEGDNFGSGRKIMEAWRENGNGEIRREGGYSRVYGRRNRRLCGRY